MSKAAVLAIHPKAACVKRQFGSLTGWVVYRNGQPEIGDYGIGSGRTPSEAWSQAQDRVLREVMKGNDK